MPSTRDLRNISYAYRESTSLEGYFHHSQNNAHNSNVRNLMFAHLLHFPSTNLCGDFFMFLPNRTHICIIDRHVTLGQTFFSSHESTLFHVFVLKMKLYFIELQNKQLSK